MGCFGVQSAAELLAGKETEQEIVTSAAVITKKTMFDESSQKIMFRFQQTSTAA